MRPDNTVSALADVASRLDAASADVDRLVASDDPEVSYAATTAVLHLHAAQAELGALPPTDPAPPAANDAAPGQAADALAELAALANDTVASVPVEQQAGLARVALHVAGARDALGQVA